jgi:hypothetical protein
VKLTNHLHIEPRSRANVVVHISLSVAYITVACSVKRLSIQLHTNLRRRCVSHYHFLQNLTQKYLKNNIITYAQRSQHYTENMGDFTFHSPLIQKLKNLFRNTDLKTTLRITNTIHSILHTRTDNTVTQHQRGIYKMKCQACKRSYIGQTD